MGDDTDANRAQQERDELERRVRAGAWLKAGAVAKLLGAGRTTIHNMLINDEIRYRRTPRGTQRECDPRDVIRLLDAQRPTRGDDAEPGE